MSMELKSQINTAEQEKDIRTLEEIQENAEAGFEGEIAGLAKAALDRLHGKVEDAEKTPDHVVEKLGEEKFEEVTAEVDKEIEALQEKTEGEIEGVVGDIELNKEQTISKIENSNITFESFSGLTNIQNPQNQQKVEDYKNNLRNDFSVLDKENYLKIKELYDKSSDEELIKLYDEHFPNGIQSLGEFKHDPNQKVQYYRNLSKNLENKKFISKDGLHAVKLFELKNKGDSSWREEFAKLYHKQALLESNYKEIDYIQKESSNGFNEKAELEKLSKELDNKSAPDFQYKVLQQIFDYSKKHLETFDKLYYLPMDVPDYKEDFFKFIASQPKDSFIGKLGELYKEAYLKTLKKNPNLQKIKELEEKLKDIKSQSRLNTNTHIDHITDQTNSLINSINALGPKVLSEGDSYGVSQAEIDKALAENE